MKFLLCISNAFTLTPWHKTRLKFRSVNASWDVLQCSPTRRSTWAAIRISQSVGRRARLDMGLDGLDEESAEVFALTLGSSRSW